MQAVSAGPLPLVAEVGNTAVRVGRGGRVEKSSGVSRCTPPNSLPSHVPPSIPLASSRFQIVTLPTPLSFLLTDFRVETFSQPDYLLRYEQWRNLE